MRGRQHESQIAKAAQQLSEVEHKLRLVESELTKIQVLNPLPPTVPPSMCTVFYPLSTVFDVWYRHRNALRQDVRSRCDGRKKHLKIDVSPTWSDVDITMVRTAGDPNGKRHLALASSFRGRKQA